MGKHMGYDTKAKILIQNAKKHYLKSISKIVKRPKQTVFNFLQRYNLRQSIHNNYQSNKPRVFDDRSERRLVRLALGNRRATTKQLKEMLGISASESSIRLALKRNGVTQCRPIKKPLLKKEQKRKRLEWARAHANWGQEQWRRVIFSDEAKIILNPHIGNVRIWRREGEELLPECIEPTRKFGGGSIMIWGGIAGNGLRMIEEIEGTLTATKYVEILENNVRTAFDEYWNDFDYFQEDNDPKHGGPRGAKLTKEWFGNNSDIIRMEWPVNSPDLNPIEQMWYLLKKRVALSPNRTKENLFETVQSIWNSIPTEEIWKLIDSMPRRIIAVIKNNGGNTKY